MTTLRKVQSMLGLAFAAAIGAMALTASASDAVEEDAVCGEETDQPYQPYLPPGSLRCTMSGATETGREWGAVFMTNKPGICRRLRLGGPAPVDFASCHDRGRNELGCQVIVD